MSVRIGAAARNRLLRESAARACVLLLALGVFCEEADLGFSKHVLLAAP